MNLLSQKGLSYRRGKPLQNDLRSLVIDAIVDAGGDIVTGYFQGNFAAIARTFKLQQRSRASEIYINWREKLPTKRPRFY